MCPHIGGTDEAQMKDAHRVPKGRPPYGHKYEAGAWINISTGQPLDPNTHAYEMQLKKRACMKQGYWERGGRQRRLRRYARKCQRSRPQRTIDTFTAPLDRAKVSHGAFNHSIGRLGFCTLQRVHLPSGPALCGSC